MNIFINTNNQNEQKMVAIKDFISCRVCNYSEINDSRKDVFEIYANGEFYSFPLQDISKIVIE